MWSSIDCVGKSKHSIFIHKSCSLQMFVIIICACVLSVQLSRSIINYELNRKYTCTHTHTTHIPPTPHTHTHTYSSHTHPLHTQHDNPRIQVVLNDGTRQYQHHIDGKNTESGGCVRDFRNRPYPVKMKVVYLRGTLEVGLRGLMTVYIV